MRISVEKKYIINTARVNEDPKARLIRELRAEIEKLRNQKGIDDDEDIIQASLTEIETLRQKLASKEKEMAAKERSWQDRLKKSEEQKREESRLLERSGIAFKMDTKKPHLVNLNEDPQLSEMLLYVLKEVIDHCQMSTFCHYRFSHPSDTPGQRKSQISGAPKDFEFARQELIQVQDAR
ncbi:hypothetical protein LSH36_238g01020 [Paralvinella palmiformis]|uniref:Kinesin-associated domain-containing protein n=1 Tax=Paralvinella palmiformis TaxID=53620 RepID=A0AAD9JLM5_9ANNE|nr:hypothetical protein LSH36_238g01020 [Paralvinella palmiformis]